MALKATVFKFKLNISDLERHVYEDFSLSLARHPSETDARMMLRLAAFARHASADLGFGRGISTDDEPDLWQKDLTGAIELWIDLGNPDPDRIRKACARSQQVVLYCYGERSTTVWWEKQAAGFERFNNLAVYAVNDSDYGKLSELAKGDLVLQCTVSDNDMWFTANDETVAINMMPLSFGGA